MQSGPNKRKQQTNKSLSSIQLYEPKVCLLNSVRRAEEEEKNSLHWTQDPLHKSRGEEQPGTIMLLIHFKVFLGSLKQCHPSGVVKESTAGLPMPKGILAEWSKSLQATFLCSLGEILTEAYLMVWPVNIPDLSSKLSHLFFLLKPQKAYNEGPWWGSRLDW